MRINQLSSGRGQQVNAGRVAPATPQHPTGSGVAELTQNSGGGSGRGYRSSGGSSDTGYQSNPYADYLAAAQAARAAAIEKANAALDAQGRAIEQRYNNQLTRVGQDYQDLKNERAVNLYKSLRNLRETQANRGLLDSGAGRQENLNVSNAYNSDMYKIGVSEENEKNDIQQAINELWAEIAMRKAQNEMATINDYEGMLQGILSSGAGAYQYNPQASDYYAAAQSAASSYSPANRAVENGVATSGASTAAMQQYLDELNPINIRNLKRRI